VSTNDGRDAYRLLQATQFCGRGIDMSMPYLQGSDLFGSCALKRLMRIPVMLITASLISAGGKRACPGYDLVAEAVHRAAAANAADDAARRQYLSRLRCQPRPKRFYQR